MEKATWMRRMITWMKEAYTDQESSGCDRRSFKKGLSLYFTLNVIVNTKL